MFTGKTVDNPRPGLIMSKHFTVASTTNSVLVLKPLRFVIVSSMSLKKLMLKNFQNIFIGMISCKKKERKKN